MLATKKLVLLGMVAIVLVIIYSQVLGTKWTDVNIKHYDGKVSAGQEFDPNLQTGIEKCKGRKARAYFNYIRDARHFKGSIDEVIVWDKALEIGAMSASDAYTVWNMDEEADGGIIDSKGRHNAKSFNTEIVEGHSGKARRFDGKDSYIQTPVNLQGWKGVTISLWVKPEHKDGSRLSVILDNGHDVKNNFALQLADPGGERWVWYCAGRDIFFNLPLNKWTNVVVVADGENGIVRAYTNGSKGTEVRVDGGFEFGPTPLTIGGLARPRDILDRVHPVVRAATNGDIVISHKEMSDGKSVEQWRLSGSLDGAMKDVVPGGGRVIEGASHSVKGWTIEWWKHPTSPVEVIIITNPNGKSRTFRIEWSPK